MDDQDYTDFMLGFAPFQIEWCGMLHPTAEHAYQAAHFIVYNHSRTTICMFTSMEGS